MLISERNWTNNLPFQGILMRFLGLLGMFMLGAIAPQLTAQIVPAGQWPQYRGDFSGSGYSELSAISPENIGKLEVAWTYSLRSFNNAEDPNPNSQITPIVVSNVMYLSTVDSIVALDPQLGTELWRHPVETGRPSRRGVAYWGGNDKLGPRIIFTAGSQLTALSALSGDKDASFGDNGVIDIGIPYISVPLIYKDLIIVGANTPPGTRGGIGNPRAFSAIDGTKIWEFNSVPVAGEIGHDSWEGMSWENRLGANAWPFYFTVDTDKDFLYLPLASPLPFAFGGDRAGDNLFANSIVAVDIHSGEYRWHFQTIHHDLWDHDPPAPPTLFDIDLGGRTLPALAATTKSGYLFLLNRITGEAIFGVEERTVPASPLDAEAASPTQPIPVSPPPMARVSFNLDDIVRADSTSPEHASACAALVAQLGEIFNEGPYTPWTLRDENGSGGTTLLFPGLAGGPNWGGVAFDPNSSLAFVFAADLGTLGWLETTEQDFPYQLALPRPSAFAVTIDGQTLPCQEPPWSHLTAVDTTTGDIVWRIPLGVSESLPPGKQDTGRPGRAAALVTAGDLLFIASTDDNRVRGLQASTGEILWEHKLNRRGNANPMTYLDVSGRQLIAIAATDELIVFGLGE